MASVIKKIESEAVALFPKNRTILVAVSGGPDSMVLLHSLNILSKKYNWRIRVAHFNHMLRGPASNADQCFVSKFTEQLNMNIVLGKWAKDTKLIKECGLEMAARESRYHFLLKAANKLRCKYIATGHHSDDQIETFLWRLMRGAGGKGLGGIQPLSPMKADEKIILARPLLKFNKKDLLEYARTNSIPFRQDATNSNTKYLRNKIRKNLLPYLMRNYGPNLKSSILQSQSLISAEADYSKRSAQDWLEAEPRPPFTGLHKAVQRWIIWCQLVELNIEPQYSMIESLIYSLAKPISIEKGKRIFLNSDGILCLKSTTSLSYNNQQAVIHPKNKWTTHDFGNIRIKCRIAPQQNPENRNGEIFDAQYLGENILLRYWQPGDRFHPIGNKSSSKLQDLLTNAKFGAYEKRSCIVACNGTGAPFWVQGLRIGELAKTTNNTTKFLHWMWSKI